MLGLSPLSKKEPMLTVVKVNNVLKTADGDWRITEVFMRQHPETHNWIPCVTIQSLKNPKDSPTLEWGQILMLLTSEEATLVQA